MPLIRKALTKPQMRSSRRLPSLTGSSTSSSVSVTPERSLQIGAVYSCVRLLSEAVSSLPVAMFERSNGARTPIETNPMLYLVKEMPNPDIDAGELWRTVIGWMLLRGNAYVYVERNGAGAPIGLWPIAPSSVEVKRVASGRLAYTVTLDDTEYAPLKQGTTVQAVNMLHYRAFGLGVEGLSPIGLARQSVGIAFAAQQYMGGFFARDASPGGVVSVDGTLSDEQYERLVLQWKNLHEGFDNSHKLAVMEGGAKWEQTTLPPADAQFIETQKFTRGEIASIYGVPPHMIGDTEKSTSWGSGIAEQGIGFVTYSLRPWLNRLERVTGRLITSPTLKLRWNVDGLMQGDTKSRYDAYAVGKQWGWLSTNDIRKREDEEPVENGDSYLQPLNMVPAGTSPVQRTSRGTRTRRAVEAPADAQTAWVTRHRDALVSVFGEQRDDVLANLRSGSTPLDRDDWDERLASLLLGLSVGLSTEAASRVAAELGGDYDPARALAFLTSAAARRASNINLSTENAIDRALNAAAEADEDPVEHINAAFDEAESSRAPLVAAALVNQMGNFARHEGAVQSGAGSKTWIVTSSNPRPSHAVLNGQTVGMDETFSNGAMWPGDAAMDVSEIAGCTCSVEFSRED
jgi:HK97 family phage portal protein